MGTKQELEQKSDLNHLQDISNSLVKLNESKGISYPIIVQGVLVALIVSLSGVAFNSYNEIRELKTKVAIIEKYQEKREGHDKMVTEVRVTLANLEQDMKEVKEDLRSLRGK